MGQQQLLLLMLGVIVVGIAVVIGINVFNASSTSHKRDILLNECINLASMAQSYFRKPTVLGGGSRSFSGWKIPSGLKTTENGNFIAITTANDVTITGTGNEVLSNGDTILVQMKILPNNTEILQLK